MMMTMMTMMMMMIIMMMMMIIIIIIIIIISIMTKMTITTMIMMTTATMMMMRFHFSVACLAVPVLSRCCVILQQTKQSLLTDAMEAFKLEASITDASLIYAGSETAATWFEGAVPKEIYTFVLAPRVQVTVVFWREKPGS